MIVKTEPYAKEQVAKVLQLRANIEGLKLAEGVLDKLATEGEKSSLRYLALNTLPPAVRRIHTPHFCRYALQLLAPASIIASINDRSEISLEDVGEMNELFLDAKTSAAMIGASENLKT